MAGRPVSVIEVAFAHGKLQIQTNESAHNLHAIMKKDGEICLESISETEVRLSPQGEPQYVLGDEKIYFDKKQVVFYVISTSKDAPLIDRSAGGLIPGMGIVR